MDDVLVVQVALRGEDGGRSASVLLAPWLAQLTIPEAMSLAMPILVAQGNGFPCRRDVNYSQSL